MAVKNFEEVLTEALQLSPVDKARLVERLAATLEHDLENVSPKPKRSLYGLCADLGPAPSAEDIDEVRREVWANFPRDDI